MSCSSWKSVNFPTWTDQIASYCTANSVQCCKQRSRMNRIVTFPKFRLINKFKLQNLRGNEICRNNIISALEFRQKLNFLAFKPILFFNGHSLTGTFLMFKFLNNVGLLLKKGFWIFQLSVGVLFLFSTAETLSKSAYDIL